MGKNKMTNPDGKSGIHQTTAQYISNREIEVFFTDGGDIHHQLRQRGADANNEKADKKFPEFAVLLKEK